MKETYVHGYDPSENIRLQDQASTLVELLHSDTFYPPGSRVLEAGCGVGAQTVSLAANSPEAIFISVDISEESVNAARRTAEAAGITNVDFRQGTSSTYRSQKDRSNIYFSVSSWNTSRDPLMPLRYSKGYLKEGGTITVIEGNHGSAYFYPESEFARMAIDCQVELQRRSGGNANIGRELYPLLQKAEYKDIRVSPRMVNVDSTRPGFVEGFTKKTFTAMIEGVREAALAAGITDESAFDRGIRDLYRTAEADGVFCYTFFKAVAVKG